MIVHVMHRAKEADVGPVLVAAAEQEIADVVEAAGGMAILTEPDLPSGSDRIHQALTLYDPNGNHDAVVNVQGDLPTIEPAAISVALQALAGDGVDIATLAAVITRESERDDPNVVKAVVPLAKDARQGRALYFTRAAAPAGDGPLLHHIGLYAYRRVALERFIKLPPGVLEQRQEPRVGLGRVEVEVRDRHPRPAVQRGRREPVQRAARVGLDARLAAADLRWRHPDGLA